MKNYEQVNEALSAQVLWKSATHTHTHLQTCKIHRDCKKHLIST